MEYNTVNSVFRSGAYTSYYYRSGTYHGPHYLNLVFGPDAGYIVRGIGIDDVGAYAITGVYSSTLRMGLEKHYQPGTGDPSQNLGHTVIIQVEWNHRNQQFEGKYYLRTRNHRDENVFVIRLQHDGYWYPYTIESQV